MVIGKKKENIFMSNATKNSIETKNLHVGYQQKNSVNLIQQNISIQLAKGEFVGILGKNGIGKSTLLRTLTGVQDAISGDVIINGKNIKSYNYRELSTIISLVLTEQLPDSQLTVFDLVALGRQPYTNWVGKLEKKDLEKIRWALEQTETTALAHRYFYELSDGQLQRVLIARALAQDTQIIMLDEPTAHLDMHHTIKIFQLLKKLSQETNKTIIMTTHEVNLAIKGADQLILLTDKEVVAGNKKTLIERNSFDHLFSSEIVNFNENLEQFIITKES
ncbi:ABC transporter ATP-binding protein [Flavobacteriaceae bacterium]|nr:ABC transporter ATP-binding protein [Flavobacteriaceae bacterium]